MAADAVLQRRQIHLHKGAAILGGDDARACLGIGIVGMTAEINHILIAGQNIANFGILLTDGIVVDDDLVVTGEGRTDWQSCFGKVMQGVGVHAKAKDIPVAGLSGSLGKNALDICEYGVSSLMTTVNAPMSLDEALDRAEELYLEGAIRMFRFIKAGMDMR